VLAKVVVKDKKKVNQKVRNQLIKLLTIADEMVNQTIISYGKKLVIKHICIYILIFYMYCKM